MSASLKYAEPPPEKVVRFQLPRKLAFLLEPHEYKVAYGGRGSLKSTSFASTLLTQGIQQKLRVLCAREVQKSLAQSCHLLLTDRIKALGYQDEYTPTENAIRGRRHGTLFQFVGLSDQTAESVKSYEGFNRLWGEEAQALSKRSLQIVLPTIFRTPGAEAWFSFNPELESDEVWERFIVNPPPGAFIQEMNWRDAVACGWHTPAMEQLRQYDLVHSPADYPTIWEGKPRTVLPGAIYATEIVDLVKDGRLRPIPYDPRLPVHRIWDLGWNDAMAVVMVQKPHPSALNIINYFEDNRLSYAQVLAAMDPLGYRWGLDWLPHDASQHHPTSGANAFETLRRLGCRFGSVNGELGIPRSNPNARIDAARMMFPRVYFDNSKRETPPERPERLLGAGYLLDRLRRYKRNIPKTTGEPAEPTHDASSHGADAYGGLAEIVDRIKNDGDQPAPSVPGFRNVDAGMGLLG